MPSEKRQFGDRGEEFAAKYLEQKGYKILERNFLAPWGELDIVAAKTGLLGFKLRELIFVEVKSIEGAGSERDMNLAAQNVHAKKQQRLIHTAKTYLINKKIPPAVDWRIDVLLVAIDPFSNSAKIEHLENAVWGK